MLSVMASPILWMATLAPPAGRLACRFASLQGCAFASAPISAMLTSRRISPSALKKPSVT